VVEAAATPAELSRKSRRFSFVMKCLLFEWFSDEKETKNMYQ